VEQEPLHLVAVHAPQKLELLLTPLNKLGVTVEGCELAEAIRVTRADMKRVGINKLQPHFYLSTGYGTITGTTSIALGFYDCMPLLKDLNEEFRGFRYSYDDVVNLVEESYAPGATMGGAFRNLIEKILGRFSLLFIDPLKPAIRQLAAPFLHGAIDKYFSSPVAADDKVFLIGQGGQVSVLKAAGEWEVMTVNELDDECFATPAIADGHIYIRTRSALYNFGK